MIVLTIKCIHEMKSAKFCLWFQKNETKSVNLILIRCDDNDCVKVK